MYEQYFVPYPLLETDRLIIRSVRRKDAKELYELCRRPETSRYSRWSPHADLDVTKSFISYQLGLKRKKKLTAFVIIEKRTKRLIGTCSYVTISDDYKIAEIGYSLLKEYWGNGFASEAVKALLWFGFETIGLQRITANVLPENRRSIALLERCHFTEEGRLKKGFHYNGKVSDMLLYSITDDEYGENYMN